MSKTKKEKNNGKFAKGTSGNPSGRPPGSRNRSTLMMESILEEDAQEIIGTLVDMAKGRNIHAIRLCMERLVPPGRDRLVSFDLPPMRSVDDVSLGIRSIISAVSEGKLTPQEGEILSRILAEHANVMYAADVKGRLEKLEEKLTQATAPDEANVTIQ
jgi:hypothetical protein